MMRGVDLICLGLLIGLLLPICLVDLRQQRIPNLLTLGVAVLGLVHAVLRDPQIGAVLWVVGQGALAVAVFAATALLVRLVNRAARIGGGDLKLLVAASFWVGLDGSVMVLLVACVVLVAVTVAAAPWQGMDLRRMRPFGPMLAVSMVAVVWANLSLR